MSFVEGDAAGDGRRQAHDQRQAGQRGHRTGDQVSEEKGGVKTVVQKSCDCVILQAE